MKNVFSDRLQQICFADAVDFSFVSSKDRDTDLLNKGRAPYVERLRKWSSTWPSGSLNAACPHPVLITDQHHDELSDLHQALNLAIEDIIDRWWTDEQAQFPQRMPLEQEEEDLLRVSQYSLYFR